MFIVDPFINSTGLAIVAETDLLGGYFLSEKSCYKLVVSTSFWYQLLNVSSVLTTKKYSNFFWVVNVVMRCGYGDGS